MDVKIGTHPFRSSSFSPVQVHLSAQPLVTRQAQRKGISAKQLPFPSSPSERTCHKTSRASDNPRRKPRCSSRPWCAEVSTHLAAVPPSVKEPQRPSRGESNEPRKPH